MTNNTDTNTSPDWTVEQIRAELEKSNRWLQRGLLRIYAEQTLDEQATGTTHASNGVGFNGVDAEILSSFAEQLIKRDWPSGRDLSEKQIALLRKKLPKYAKQLAMFANEKLPAPPEEITI
jgi:hypothetical protein